MTVRVELSDDGLDLVITGWFDQAMCLSRGQHLAWSAITGARVIPWDEARAGRGWRTGGAYWPGLIATGWYGVPDRKGARQLWATFRDHDHLLAVDTTLDRPTRLVVATTDAEALAARITERVGGATG